MRETENSLQLWFGFVGMVVLVGTLLDVEKVYVIAKDPFAIFSSPSVTIGLIISLITVVAYLYVAIRLRDLIVVNPNVIRAVLIAAMLYFGVVVTLLIVFTRSTKGVFWPGLEIIFNVYLLFNVNRLVRELKE